MKKVAKTRFLNSIAIDSVKKIIKLLNKKAKGWLPKYIIPLIKECLLKHSFIKLSNNARSPSLTHGLPRTLLFHTLSAFFANLVSLNLLINFGVLFSFTLLISITSTIFLL